MSTRRFVDIDEVYARLMGTLVAADDDLLIPLKALHIAVAGATTLVVPEAEAEN